MLFAGDSGVSAVELFVLIPSAQKSLQRDSENTFSSHCTMANRTHLHLTEHVLE